MTPYAAQRQRQSSGGTRRIDSTSDSADLNPTPRLRVKGLYSRLFAPDLTLIGREVKSLTIAPVGCGVTPSFVAPLERTRLPKVAQDQGVYDRTVAR